VRIGALAYRGLLAGLTFMNRWRPAAFLLARCASSIIIGFAHCAFRWNLPARRVWQQALPVRRFPFQDEITHA